MITEKEARERLGIDCPFYAVEDDCFKVENFKWFAIIRYHKDNRCPDGNGWLIEKNEPYGKTYRLEKPEGPERVFLNFNEAIRVFIRLNIRGNK